MLSVSQHCRIWNALPANVPFGDSTSTFRKQLKARPFIVEYNRNFSTSKRLGVFGLQAYALQIVLPACYRVLNCDLFLVRYNILSGLVEEVLLPNKFFPIVDTCLNCKDMARQSCAMVPR